MRFSRAAAVLLSVLLAGCDTAIQVSEMNRKMDVINADLKKTLGFEAQIGWNINNGTLTQITVLLPADKVGEQSIRQLKDMTYPVVIKHFDKAPQAFQLVTVFEREL